jgi:hypothetical protein
MPCGHGGNAVRTRLLGPLCGLRFGAGAQPIGCSQVTGRSLNQLAILLD